MITIVGIAGTRRGASFGSLLRGAAGDRYGERWARNPGSVDLMSQAAFNDTDEMIDERIKERLRASMRGFVNVVSSSTLASR